MVQSSASNFREIDLNSLQYCCIFSSTETTSSQDTPHVDTSMHTSLPSMVRGYATEFHGNWPLNGSEHGESDAQDLSERRIKVRKSQCENSSIFLSFRFYVKSILEECKSSKPAVFAILGALNFVNLVVLSLQQVQKFLKLKIQRLSMSRNGRF